MPWPAGRLASAGHPSPASRVAEPAFDLGRHPVTSGCGCSGFGSAGRSRMARTSSTVRMGSCRSVPDHGKVHRRRICLHGSGLRGPPASIRRDRRARSRSILRTGRPAGKGAAEGTTPVMRSGCPSRSASRSSTASRLASPTRRLSWCTARSSGTSRTIPSRHEQGLVGH